MKTFNAICTGYLLVAVPYQVWQGRWGWAAVFAVCLAAGIANMCNYAKEDACSTS